MLNLPASAPSATSRSSDRRRTRCARGGTKLRARHNAQRFGLPLLPGSGVLESADHAKQEAKRIGYPVILKASGGGGGRGMRVVRSEAEMPDAFASARREAESGFKNPDIYCEKYVERPRHIEFQALRRPPWRSVDPRGAGVLATASSSEGHRRSSECGPDRTTSGREMAYGHRASALRETGYSSLGTLEFLMDEHHDLYFLEMNTRLQVEHPVTEMVTGLDLVVLQIRAAAGEALELPAASPFPMNGHAIECRINAEDPKTFAPWPGVITEWGPPGGTNVRVDSGVFGGWRVPSAYDSLLAKLIVHAPTRPKAIALMRRALDEFIVSGIRTNIDLHKALLVDREVQDGTMTTRTIERITGKSR